ncbi:MAG: BON domain-containing protein [Thermoanaerobaculia bacterium]
MVRKFTLLALLATLVLALGACRSLNQVTPEQWDDEAIEVEVRAQIAEDEANDAFDIGVEVENGVVTLTGDVEDAKDRARIANAAMDVEGVRSVINNIRID